MILHMVALLVACVHLLINKMIRPFLYRDIYKQQHLYCVIY